MDEDQILGEKAAEKRLEWAWRVQRKAKSKKKLEKERLYAKGSAAAYTRATEDHRNEFHVAERRLVAKKRLLGTLLGNEALDDEEGYTESKNDNILDYGPAENERESSEAVSLCAVCPLPPSFLLFSLFAFSFSKNKPFFFFF